jgi:hypothetical protein
MLDEPDEKSVATSPGNPARELRHFYQVRHYPSQDNTECSRSRSTHANDAARQRQCIAEYEQAYMDLLERSGPHPARRHLVLSGLTGATSLRSAPCDPFADPRQPGDPPLTDSRAKRGDPRPRGRPPEACREKPDRQGPPERRRGAEAEDGADHGEPQTSTREPRHLGQPHGTFRLHLSGTATKPRGDGIAHAPR